MHNDCGNCKYWKEWKASGDEGFCHFAPPILVQAPKKDKHGDPENSIFDWEHPTTLSDDWCSFHKLKEYE